MNNKILSAWIAKANQRKDEICNAKVQAIPGDKALAQVRQILES